MSLSITKYKVTLELVEPLLGTVPKQKAVFTNFLAGKAREELEKMAAKGIPLASGEASADAAATLVEAEVETVADMEERGWTGFHSDEEGPFLYDYAVKGFLKESARTMKTYDPAENGEAEGGEEEEEGGKKKKGKPKATEIKQLQDKVSRYVFVRPRKVRLPKDMIGEPLERPLRAMTAQGPRVALTRSDVILAGARFSFEVHVLAGGGVTEGLLRDILSYAEYQGFGQWRGGGYGRTQVVEMARA